MQFRAIVHGEVQGVWFRAWTRDMAREAGVTGWVRNLPSGDVETVAEGDETRLKRFEARLWDGPPLARVTAIDATWTDDTDDFTHFEIRR
ncbi:acylphosphatase [Pseudodesulfovibrio sediminis]|uniref:Acylphosphatase n=1 Tax=Pseudodesulfovibrio sediminis TaxID=2810563 RepID=A0ABM7P9C4_9BACT|nr:acylphosphatase [Pseudodesulfovibrio sediminis]BCS89664.1 acylphosphatase [Pseudodesulfovibrio sediminis]